MEASSGEADVPTSVAELRRIYGAPTTTNLGGIFYLVNVALALELYPDFTRPTDVRIELSIWRFIAEVGARLLGDERPDPVWALLAKLADDEHPEALQFVPPEEPWLPQDWLAEPADPEPSRREGTDAERWMDWLAPHLRARLRRALGLPTFDGMAALLIEHSARVHVTDTHVDVLFSLADLPIAIRMAGLDRNPGFLPAAGRFLAFHFS